MEVERERERERKGELAYTVTTNLLCAALAQYHSGPASEAHVQLQHRDVEAEGGEGHDAGVQADFEGVHEVLDDVPNTEVFDHHTFWFPSAPAGI